MSEPAVSVVIVNYNGERLLPECLEALARQSHEPSEIIVVDNGSTDNSVELLRSRFSYVTVVDNGENLYFCKGSNIGISHANEEFILLLNNDCILDEGYIAEALAQIIQDDSIGAVTGKIQRVNSELLDCAGQLLSLSRKPLDRGYGLPDDGQYDEAAEVFSAGGVAPLIRRTMLEEIALEGEYFDEDFVQYYEDIDLFWRARNLGWSCRYSPAATARHYRGATGQSEPAVRSWVKQFAFANLPEFLQGHLLKNRYATMAKNDSFVDWLVSLPWILMYELKVLTYMLLVRQSLFARYFRGLGYLGTALRKRKAIKAMARRKGIKRYGCGAMFQRRQKVTMR
jgi:GT2 family glycosyltransferase